MKRHFFLVLGALPFLFAADLRFAHKDLSIGRYIVAARGFRNALATDPDNEVASLGLARTQVAMGRCVQGYARLLRLRQSTVWTAEASNAEGICLLRSGQFMEALAAFEESIQMRSDYPVAWYGLYQTNVRLGDGQAAERALDELTRLIPDKTLARTASLDWLQRTQPDVADVYLAAQKREVHALGNPALRRQWTMMEARRWLHLGHPAEAVRMLEPVFEQYPNNVQTAGLIAEAYRRTGDTDAAELSLKHALISVSEHPLILGTKARIAVDKGKRKQALNYFKQLETHQSAERYATEWYVFRRTNAPRARNAQNGWWSFIHHPDETLIQYVPWRK